MTHPDLIEAVPPEWRDYARQYGAAEAIQRATEAGGYFPRRIPQSPATP